MVFNELLRLGILSDILKTSYFVPPLKLSSTVIQLALGKVFASLVLNYVNFKCKCLLRSDQHVFCLDDRLLILLSRKAVKFIACIWTSPRLIDIVSHIRLLAKFKAYSVLGSLI